MTTVAPTAAAPAVGSTPAPRRRTLVGLAVVFVVLLVAFMSRGADLEPDASVADIRASVSGSEALVEWLSYATMAAGAVLCAFGAALRTALRSSGVAWHADVALVGFVVIALTVASWAVTGLALWHAVETDDPALIRAANLFDTVGFLPLMLGMACAYVGTGLAGLRRGLPTWLAVGSLGLGVVAVLGPAAFPSALLLPVWLVVVAATVRLPAAVRGA